VNRKARILNKVRENRTSGLSKRFAIFQAEGGDFGKYAVKSGDAGKWAFLSGIDRRIKNETTRLIIIYLNH